MEWLLSLFIGLVVGMVVGWNLKSSPSEDDPTGEIKQTISDKLDKAIKDIKTTV